MLRNYLFKDNSVHSEYDLICDLDNGGYFTWHIDILAVFFAVIGHS